MDIFDELTKNSSSSSKDIFDELSEQPSRLRSLASAYPKGAVKGASRLPSMVAGPIPNKLGERLLEKFLPTRKQTPEKFLERAGELSAYTIGGPEALGVKAAQVLAGAGVGQLAEEGGLGKTGQSVAEIAGMGLPSLAKSGLQKLKGLFSAQAEKLPSGLTKVRAIDAKKPSLGRLTSQMQQKALGQLDKEAATLAKSSLEKKIPLHKKIEEGFDFPSHFKKGFKDLQVLSEKSNPEVDLTPVSEFLSETRKKFRGIPSPHPDAKKIVSEARALSNNPRTSLKDLYKIYRSNNQKKSHIYETAMTGGRQREYVQFLNDLNRSIVKAFEATFPADSVWLKQFKDLNKDYGAYEATKQTLDKLRPLLKGEATAAKLEKLSSDPKTIKKLSLSMGKEGAQEISQIAQDLKLAKQAIKEIPVKDLKTMDKIFPIALILSGLKIPAELYAAYTGGRMLYGWLLTTPVRRKAYNQSLKALISNNPQEYANATLVLKRSLQEENGD
jgi:hypothetical protein